MVIKRNNMIYTNIMLKLIYSKYEKYKDQDSPFQKDC